MAPKPHRSIVSSSPTLEKPSTILPPRERVLSKDEWESIKPLIYRLYIQEEKTFARIKPTILELFGYAPTRNQFDKRVQRWGFKKNLTRDERDVLLRNGATQNIPNDVNRQAQTGMLSSKLSPQL